jgi:hypothetical protein
MFCYRGKFGVEAYFSHNRLISIFIASHFKFFCATKIAFIVVIFRFFFFLDDNDMII